MDPSIFRSSACIYADSFGADSTGHADAGRHRTGSRLIPNRFHVREGLWEELDSIRSSTPLVIVGEGLSKIN